MSIIRRLHAQETDRIEGEAGPAVTVVPPPAASSTLDELESMLAGETPSVVVHAATEPPTTPAPAQDEAVIKQETAQDSTHVAPAPAAAVPLKDEETPQNSRRGNEKPSRQPEHRAALDYLTILKSLAPVFKAATIYPGHDASPEVIGAAVRKMSQVSVGLADYIATHGDKLELDSAWSRKTLHDFTAELVASHWISTVIGKGGVVAGHSPDVTVEFFVPAIRAVMDLPADLPLPVEEPGLSTPAAIQLSMLMAMTPISIEVEKFATVITAGIPAAKVSVDDLVAEIGQFIMEQALQYHEKFIAENADVTDDDRRVLLQALIKHAAGVMLSSWEYCRGEVLGAIKDAGSVEQAAAILGQSQFTHGFPLQALKTRAEESLRRLAGTSQYALTMMRQASERANQQGA
ncbi:hypothetical protein [Chromobacterium haemolyticum]|uniref:hypothetical protein n=1 Tax=Chromobacterium haemolyticum TaxID=394935 RepID=UPI00244AF394|nr:hypothetical protein [Chromobacterium haemolyticum]MDH0342147.1 hypothetical protein [Chromobacterium haemolyticum]